MGTAWAIQCRAHTRVPSPPRSDPRANLTLPTPVATTEVTAVLHQVQHRFTGFHCNKWYVNWESDLCVANTKV